MKICTRCELPREESEYRKTTDTICKHCKYQQIKKWKKDNKDKVNKNQRDLFAKKHQTRVCYKCGETKLADKFVRTCRVCKDCQQVIKDRISGKKNEKTVKCTTKVVKVRETPKETVKIEIKPIVKRDLFKRENTSAHKDWYKKMIKQLETT